MENILYFIVGSAAISAFMEALKKTPGVDGAKWFNYTQSWIPLVLGGIGGPFTAPYLLEDVSIAWGIVFGFVAGSVSSLSYKLFKWTLKKRAGAEDEDFTQ